ncbi:MAG: hypothetical protein D6705_16885 [Deltaproteobacteria bacterium]|nr:MAG: hypothetical protein D6705_16885 [Deltaproteobacteria bacterium]
MARWVGAGADVSSTFAMAPGVDHPAAKMIAHLAAAMLVAAAAVLAPSHETRAEYLYRRGVFCMEEIERTECAVERFEALLETRTSRRELVTDAMLRLVRLYRTTGRDEDVRKVLRKFWSSGLAQRQTGHIPYLVQLLPEEVDMLFFVHGEAILRAPITKAMGPDAVAWVTTCDPGKRQWLSERRRWKRAEREAKRRGITPVEVIYEDQDAARARREARSERDDPFEDRGTPISTQVLCPFARALGQDDMRTWRKVASAISHEDFRHSYVVLEIPKLEDWLDRAAAEGRLERVRPRTYRLPDLEVDGEPILAANLDLEQVVLGRASRIEALERAASRGRRTINRKLRKLLDEVPRDAAFIFAMTEDAMVDLYDAAAQAGPGKFFKALLPRPKGLQVAAVTADYFGVFVRMPSDNPVKTALVVRLAEALLDPEDQTDPDTREFFELVDVAQTEDKRALIFAYVLDPGQVRRIFFY